MFLLTNKSLGFLKTKKKWISIDELTKTGTHCFFILTITTLFVYPNIINVVALSLMLASFFILCQFDKDSFTAVILMLLFEAMVLGLAVSWAAVGFVFIKYIILNLIFFYRAYLISIEPMVEVFIRVENQGNFEYEYLGWK